MKAFRNLIHFGVLTMFAVLGGIMTIQMLLQIHGYTPGGLAMIAGFWMWFAAYAGGSTALVNKYPTAFMAPLVHGGLYMALHMLPREMPLGLLRIGYDLLSILTFGRLAASLAVVLLATAAHAHAVAFDFVDPDGAGNRTDGGVYPVSWLDGPDPAGTTLVKLRASRPSLLPWGEVDGGATVDITPGAVAVADNNDTFFWNTAGVAAGCWHPWAQMTDPIEGSSTIVSRGLVTVVNAGNVPPSVWITNAQGETSSDAGIFSLRFEVDDPEDETAVTLEAQQSTGAPRRLATDLPFPSGGGNGSFPVDVGALGGGVWYLHALVRDGDGGTCDAWWPGALYLSAVDAGVDAGAVDSGNGGAGGGGADGSGGGGAPPATCGCTSVETIHVLAFLVVWLSALRLHSSARSSARNPSSSDARSGARKRSR